MNKKGQQNSFAEIIGGLFALFFAFVFFGIIFPILNEVSGSVFPGFSFLIILSFVVIILTIVASIIRAIGEKI